MVREQRVAVGLGLFAVLYLISAWRLPRFVLQTAVIDAHVFPMVLGAVLLLLCTIYFVQAGRKAAREGAPAPLLDGVDRPLLLRLFGVTLGYALVLSTLGYLLATALFLSITMWLLGVRAWGRNLAVAAGFAVVTYVVFTRLLEIPLARGILPF